MNRRRAFLAVLLCFAVGSTALAINYNAFSKKVTGLALTGTACTSLSGTSTGVDLTSVNGWRAIASAPAGQTFTGGTAQCCFYSATNARWSNCDSKLNLTLTSGARDVVGLDNRSSVGMGRLHYVGSSVTLSGGTTFDMAYEMVQQ